MQPKEEPRKSRYCPLVCYLIYVYSSVVNCILKVPFTLNHNCRKLKMKLLSMLHFWATLLPVLLWLIPVFSRLLESCFRFSLIHRKPPLFCRQGYLKQQGVTHNSLLRQYSLGPGLMPTEQDADPSEADTAFSKYLAQAEASMSSGLKLDFLP